MSAVSEAVLKETTGYLGPASKQFLERQTKKHMNDLPFEDLELKHLPELAKWIKISAGMIIDKKKADELSEKILVIR